MDKLILSGRLGRDTEIRQVGDKSFAKNSVAINRKNVRGDKQTMWVSLIAYDQQAKIMETYGKAGTGVIIMGRLVFDAVTGGPKIYTKQNGQPGAIFEIIVDSIELTGVVPEA